MTQLNDLEQLGSVIEKFHSNSVCEPFDPAYISNKPYEIPDLSAYEKRFYHKISIVINKLRRNHIPFEWMEDAEVFRVKKFRYTNINNGKPKRSEYPTYMYIAIYDNKEYSFGGEKEDLIVSTRISEVIEEVIEWLNNNEPASR